MLVLATPYVRWFLDVDSAPGTLRLRRRLRLHWTWTRDDGNLNLYLSGGRLQDKTTHKTSGEGDVWKFSQLSAVDLGGRQRRPFISQSIREATTALMLMRRPPLAK